MTFRLTDKQLEATALFGGKQRHTMIVGGGRSGKTFFIVRAIVIRALRSPKSRHVIWRQRYNACRASVWLDTFPKVMRLCFPGVNVTPHAQDGYVSLPNGAEIWFAGLDDKERVEKILGMEFATVYLNECSQIAYASMLMALTRLAQKADGLTNRFYCDLNPTTKAHWTFKLFVENVDPLTARAVNPEQYAWMRINPDDNLENIDSGYLDALEAMPEKMRRRFREGAYVTDIEGALWTPEVLASSRIAEDEVPELDRIVVAVDPSGASGKEDERSDEIGISVCGSAGNNFYVFADASGRYSPENWGALACRLRKEYGADRIVGESNYGGDMVRAVVQGADANAPYKKVTATRGKTVRAEPVASLWERGNAFLVGTFPKLEEQLLAWTSAGYTGERSPDRADAMIWCGHELMFGAGDDGLLKFYERWNRDIAAARDNREAHF